MRDEKKLRIGIYHTTLPSGGRKVGGVEVFVSRLAAAFAIRNYDVEVLSLTKAMEGSPFKNRLLFGGMKLLYKKRFCRLYILPVLLNFVDFSAYDVLHFHGEDWAYVNRRVPTVRTFHGSTLWEARSATSLKRKLSQYTMFPLELIANRLADVSMAVGREAAELYNADRIANLFVSNLAFYPGEKTSFPSFLFIGSWKGRKRGEFIFEKFTQEILPVAPKSKLYMACDLVPRSDSVVDLCSPSEATLAAVLRQSWALLSASTYEGFGIPYLEAMASGTCVITTVNSGANYVLDNGKYGMIVEDRHFSGKVIELINEPSLRVKYQEAGLLRAQEFSEEMIVSEHITLYEMAIERFHRGNRN